jgi:hypothetical protein
VLPTAGSRQGSWEGPGGIAPLPGARTLLGLVGLPNGQLIAAGGFVAGSPNTRADVYGYDPAANSWTPLAPLPKAAFGLGLATQGARQIFATGGFDRNTSNRLDMLAAAIHDQLPSVSTSGPYTALAGDTLHLSALGSDPEGDPLEYAWDLDGSLRYATPGRQIAFPTAGLTPGPRTVRVRALDPLGGYAITSTTVTVVAPAQCSPRPQVSVATVRVGTGQLQAVIAAQTSPATPSNALQRIAVTRIDNATVTLNGGPIASGDTVTLPAGTPQATLLVQRQNPGAHATVAFTVTDICGSWPSFVGGGATAF